MAGSSHQNHSYAPQFVTFDAGAAAPTAPLRRGRGAARTGDGAIVAVQGGHIVRSTGRKDRHSKVCTAKGPRDRRVRLSAHTAIQFYDVQDRLGYDRPSKAVDWLMRNAKDAIDKLDELPPWEPFLTPAGGASNAVTVVGDTNGRDFTSAGFFPDSDAIDDTIKSSFPIAVSGADAGNVDNAGPQVGFHNYSPDLSSRADGHQQELRLSLHSFQEPIFHHHLRSESSSLEFNAAPGSFAMPWNAADSAIVAAGAPALQQLHPVIGHGQPFHQRGTLQSSTRRPTIRSIPMQPGSYTTAIAGMPSSIGYSSSAAFNGFSIPAHYTGGAIAVKPPAPSADSFP